MMPAQSSIDTNSKRVKSAFDKAVENQPSKGSARLKSAAGLRLSEEELLFNTYKHAKRSVSKRITSSISLKQMQAMNMERPEALFSKADIESFVPLKAPILRVKTH